MALACNASEGLDDFSLLLSIFISKDKQTHRMEKNNKGMKENQSRRSKRHSQRTGGLQEALSMCGSRYGKQERDIEIVCQNLPKMSVLEKNLRIT